ncbi:MAG: hypothetical protein Crog4KO_18030 [Crocinitomicaceae bacterium]
MSVGRIALDSLVAYNFNYKKCKESNCRKENVLTGFAAIEDEVINTSERTEFNNHVEMKKRHIIFPPFYVG